MTAYSAAILMNGTSRFTPYSEGDSLAYDRRCVMRVEAPSIDAALSAFFAIGNRQGRDMHGFEWSSDIRSVSVGDVIQVASVTDHEVENTAYAVEPVGFRQLAAKPEATYGATALAALGLARPAALGDQA